MVFARNAAHVSTRSTSNTVFVVLPAAITGTTNSNPSGYVTKVSANNGSDLSTMGAGSDDLPLQIGFTPVRGMNT